MASKIVKEGDKYAVKTDVVIGWVYEGGVDGKRMFDSKAKAEQWCKARGLEIVKR